MASQDRSSVRWHKVWVLTLASLRGLMNFNDLKHAASRSARLRSALQLGALALVVGEGIGMSGFLTHALITSPLVVGQERAVLMLLATGACAVTFMMSSYTVSGGIFRFRGYDQIASLPITTTEMVVSRVLVTALFDVVMALVLLLPGATMYGIVVGVAWWFWPAIIIGAPLLLVVPYAAGAAVGYIAMRGTSRMRSSQLMTALLTMAGLLAFMWAINAAQASGTSGIASIATGIGAASGVYYPPVDWFTALAVDGALGLGTLFVTTAIGAAVATVWVLARVFVRTNTAVSTSHTARRSNGAATLAVSSQMATLMRGELRRLTSSALYMLNTMFGLVIMAVGGVALFFVEPSTIERLLDMPGLANALTSLTPLVLSALVLLTGISANTISLEGSSLWIVRSAPVPPRTVLLAKAGFAALVPVPFITVAAASTAWALQMGLGATIASVAIPCLASILIALVGLLANLWLPKFDWRAEVEVIKQSMAVLVTLVVGMGLAAAPFVLSATVNVAAATLLWATAATYVALIVVAIWTTLTWGAKRWDALG